MFQSSIMIEEHMFREPHGEHIPILDGGRAAYIWRTVWRTTWRTCFDTLPWLRNACLKNYMENTFQSSTVTEEHVFGESHGELHGEHVSILDYRQGACVWRTASRTHSNPRSWSRSTYLENHMENTFQSSTMFEECIFGEPHGEHISMLDYGQECMFGESYGEPYGEHILIFDYGRGAHV